MTSSLAGSSLPTVLSAPPPTSPWSGNSVRELITQLSALEDQARSVTAFLSAGGPRGRALSTDYLDILQEQARVIAALRRLRRADETQGSSSADVQAEASARDGVGRLSTAGSAERVTA